MRAWPASARGRSLRVSCDRGREGRGTTKLDVMYPVDEELLVDATPQKVVEPRLVKLPPAVLSEVLLDVRLIQREELGEGLGAHVGRELVALSPRPEREQTAGAVHRRREHQAGLEGSHVQALPARDLDRPLQLLSSAAQPRQLKDGLCRQPRACLGRLQRHYVTDRLLALCRVGGVIFKKESTNPAIPSLREGVFWTAPHWRAYHGLRFGVDRPTCKTTQVRVRQRTGQRLCQAVAWMPILAAEKGRNLHEVECPQNDHGRDVCGPATRRTGTRRDTGCSIAQQFSLCPAERGRSGVVDARRQRHRLG